MVGLDSDGAATPAVVLSIVGVDSSPLLTSLIYLLRCLALISLSTKNFRL